MQARQGAAIKKWMETGSHFPLCKRISTHHCHLELETQIMSDHHRLSRFEREALLLPSLNHPNRDVAESRQNGQTHQGE